MHGPPVYDVPIITWIWVVGLSFLSGIASYLQRYQRNVIVRRPIITFLYDIVYCQLAGLLTFFLCTLANIEGFQQAIAISLGSHMGVRLIRSLQILVKKQFYFKEKFNS